MDARQSAFGRARRLGGTVIGRGYDGGAIAGDRGYGGSLELRYDVKPKSVNNWITNRDQIQLLMFTDVAKTMTLRDPSDPQSRSSEASIASSGIGARLKRSTTWNADLWFAHAHKTINSADARGNPRLIFSLGGTF